MFAFYNICIMHVSCRAAAGFGYSCAMSMTRDHGSAPGTAEVLQGATRLADRMVAAGHVARGTDPQHRGVVTLELTASGRDLVAAAASWRRQELARILGRLAPQDQAAVTAGLGLLVDAAGDDYGITPNRPVPL